MEQILLSIEAFTAVCDAAGGQVCIPADELLIKVGRILLLKLSLRRTAAVGALLAASASLSRLGSCASRA